MAGHKFFIFMTGTLFKECMEHFSPLQMRKLQITFPRKQSTCVEESGQVAMMSQHIWYNAWFYQEFGKYNLLASVSGASVLLSLLPCAQGNLSPQITGQSEPGFIPTQIRGVSTNINQFPRHPLGVPTQLMSDTKSMQLVQILQVKCSRLSSL